MRYQIALLVTCVHLYLEFWYLFNYFPACLLQWAVGWFPLSPTAHLHSILHTFNWSITYLSMTFLSSSHNCLLALLFISWKSFLHLPPLTSFSHLTSRHYLFLLSWLATRTLSSLPHFLSCAFASSNPSSWDAFFWILILQCPHSPGFSIDICPRSTTALQWSCPSLSRPSRAEQPLLHWRYHILSLAV